MASFMECSDLRLKHPFSSVFVGSSMGGKTTRILQMIDSREHVIDTDLKRIIIIYGCDQPKFDKYREDDASIVEFYQWGSPEIQPENFANFKKSWIIIDDAIDSCPYPNLIREMACKLSHHYDFSFTLVTHNFYTKVCKDWHEITQNLHYIFYCCGKRNFDQFTILSRQILSQDWRVLIEIYKKIIEEEKYSYVLLDLHPSSAPFAKIRSHLLPSEWPMRIYVPRNQKIITK